MVDESCTVAKLTNFAVTVRRGYGTINSRRHNTILSTFHDEFLPNDDGVAFKAETPLSRCPSTHTDGRAIHHPSSIVE
jgi:hypothetical protein